MSLINKMLQDLDRRQALATAGDIPAVQVRSSVTERAVQRRGNFWIVVAVLLAIGISAGIWAAWHMRPSKLVSDSAFQAAAEAQKHALPLPGPAITPAAPPPPAPAAVDPKAPDPTATQAAPAPQPAPAAAPAQPDPAPEPFKLAQSIETPIRERVEPTPPKPEVVAPKAAPAPVPAPAAVAPAPLRQESSEPPARTHAQKEPKAEPRSRRAAPEAAAKVSPKDIEKRERGKPVSEAAEAQYRRAVTLLNGGRVSEAEDQFAAALHTDPGHSAARQAYVALLLEQRRVDTARRVLADGLALNPLQPTFALMLGRIYAEQRDYPAALDVMDRAGSSARSPDFQSLRGAVLQRMGRHAEAVDAFGNATRSSPQPGTTWIGYGISLEALGRRPEAAQAYRRALAAGPLTQELRDYAESRARALE